MLERQIVPFVTFRFGICEVDDHVHRRDLGDAVLNEGDDGFDLVEGVVYGPVRFAFDVDGEFHVSSLFHELVGL